jgi:hypothetical protein
VRRYGCGWGEVGMKGVHGQGASRGTEYHELLGSE